MRWRSWIGVMGIVLADCGVWAMIPGDLASHASVLVTVLVVTAATR
jgi:hypothetical protein